MDGWAIPFFFSTHSFFFPFRLFFLFFSSTSLLSSLFCLFAFHLLYTSLLSLLPLLFLSPQYPQDVYNINKARSLSSLSEPLPFSLFSFSSSSRFCQILWFSSFFSPSPSPPPPLPLHILTYLIRYSFLSPLFILLPLLPPQEDCPFFYFSSFRILWAFFSFTFSLLFFLPLCFCKLSAITFIHFEHLQLSSYHHLLLLP